MIPEQVDVAIVGAGTAGAAAAALCAQRGLRVLCVDRGGLDQAGARWVNGVPERAFAAAGIDPPVGDELRGTDVPFHLIAGRGPTRMVMRDHGVLEVDMRLLVSRLQSVAREAGAELVGNVNVTGAEDSELHTDRGTTRADWIVDASGLAGARLLEQPKVDPNDICTAAQEVREVTDRAAAQAFFDEHEVGSGEVLCFAGICGGFSILNLRYEGDTLSLLTGSIPAQGHPSGKQILRGFVDEQPWIGRELFGGARGIPLRRPYDRIADGRTALIGDAACQVFPAHASGIGAGLVAARVLADALSKGRGVRAYQSHWQRKHGGLMASYDLFRRFSQALEEGELERMMIKGIMDPDIATCGLAQRFPRPALASLPAKLIGLLSEPSLAARMADVVARMVAARALYAAYPREPAQLRGWSRRVAFLFGDAPDIP